MQQQPGLKLILRKDHKFIGPTDEHGHLWAVQDGILFAWSESNVQYESAWWLEHDGTPIKGSTPGQQSLIDSICNAHPFNKEWLNAKGILYQPKRS